MLVALGNTDSLIQGIFSYGIQNPNFFFLWNQVSWTLESGIPLTIGNRNPVPGIRNPKRGIQNPRLSWITLNGVQTAPH